MRPEDANARPTSLTATGTGINEEEPNMTEKGTRGRPPTARTLRDMALDDIADSAEVMANVIQMVAHIQRRLAVAHAHSTRSYHRIVGAQEHDDRKAQWDGVDRRRQPQDPPEAEAAATLQVAA